MIASTKKSDFSKSSWSMMSQFWTGGMYMWVSGQSTTRNKDIRNLKYSVEYFKHSAVTYKMATIVWPGKYIHHHISHDSSSVSLVKLHIFQI